jgi:hypothetical protein
MSELPLASPWERQAVKSLAQALYLLAHGDFTSPADLANWLKHEADALAVESEGQYWDEGEPVGLKCPECRSEATNYEPTCRTWKCEDCSLVWHA